jgi:hypothetical protein
MTRARREDVEALAAEMDPWFLECRELGHNWRNWTARRTDDGTYDRGLKCARCGSVRWQEISIRGVVLRERREYPDGYLSPRGFGRISADGKDALRVESLRRELGDG